MKLKHDEPLSSSALKFNFCGYKQANNNNDNINDNNNSSKSNNGTDPAAAVSGLGDLVGALGSRQNTLRAALVQQVGPASCIPPRRRMLFKLSSVLEGLVPLIPSKWRVWLLKDRDPVRLPDTWSAGFSPWTVLIGRTDFATTTTIPNPTLSLRNEILKRVGLMWWNQGLANVARLVTG
jgi:hypothetical protein